MKGKELEVTQEELDRRQCVVQGATVLFECRVAGVAYALWTY
jgi:hypothetical protein